MEKSFISIDLVRLKENYHFYQRSGKKIIGIVKDNAYGHGLIDCSLKLVKEGCDFLAVSSIDEGIKLRNHKIFVNIIVLGYLSSEDYFNAYLHNFSCPIYSLLQLENLINLKLNFPLKVHIKINSGMNRNGVQPSEFKKIMDLINENKHLLLEGIFTHYVGGEENIEYVVKQYSNFYNLVYPYLNNNLIIHASSTNSCLLIDDNISTHIRIGLGLYGLSDDIDNQVLKLEAPIVQMYKVKKGDCVGYNNAFVCKRDGYIYTLPIGYADGYKLCENHLAFKESFLNQAGKISMDYSAFFSTTKYKIGDKLELYSDNIKIVDMEKTLKISRYDLVCSLHEKITRYYLEY